jgi:hypothetical protein
METVSSPKINKIKKQTANYFVPEIVDYYNKKDSAREVYPRHSSSNLSYEDQIQHYASVRIW